MSSEIAASIKQRIDLLAGQHRSTLETASHLLVEIRRLSSAHAALIGEPMPELDEAESVSPTPFAPPARKSDKPTMGRAKIEDAVREVLMFAPLTAKEILDRISAIAAKGDHSRKGLHLVLPRLLSNHSDFELVGDKWKLRSTAKGLAAFITRVRDVLSTTGPLPESELRKEVEVVHNGANNGRLEAALNRALCDGPFEFTGVSWRVKA